MGSKKRSSNFIALKHVVDQIVEKIREVLTRLYAEVTVFKVLIVLQRAGEHPSKPAVPTVYLDPEIDEMDVANELVSTDITFYGFIKSTFWGDFDEIALLTGGDIYHLGTAAQMEEDLSEIFSDECWE